MGLFALAFLVIVLLAGLLAPLIAPHDPMMVDMKNRLAPCSFEHLLGTDHLGRDLFSRLLYGARTSMGMTLSVMLVTVGVGSLLGLVAGAFRGIFDTILMRVTDVFMSFPSEVLVLALVGMAGPRGDPAGEKFFPGAHHFAGQSALPIHRDADGRGHALAAANALVRIIRHLRAKADAFRIVAPNAR